MDGSSTSFMLAAGVGGIYLVFTPLVLLGIYIFIDRLADRGREPRRAGASYEQKDPALWRPADVRQYLKDRRKFK